MGYCSGKYSFCKKLGKDSCEKVSCNWKESKVKKEMIKPGAPKSKNSNKRIVITFQNKAGKKVELLWLDYDGKMKSYGWIPNG